MTDNTAHALTDQVQLVDQQLTQIAAANAMSTAQVLTSLNGLRSEVASIKADVATILDRLPQQ